MPQFYSLFLIRLACTDRNTAYNDVAGWIMPMLCTVTMKQVKYSDPSRKTLDLDNVQVWTTFYFTSTSRSNKFTSIRRSIRKRALRMQSNYSSSTSVFHMRRVIQWHVRGASVQDSEFDFHRCHLIACTTMTTTANLIHGHRCHATALMQLYRCQPLRVADHPHLHARHLADSQIAAEQPSDSNVRLTDVVQLRRI